MNTKLNIASVIALAGALAVTPAHGAPAYAQLLPGHIGKAIDLLGKKVKTERVDRQGQSDSADEQDKQSGRAIGLSGARNEAYEKLAEAASTVAASAGKHEHPDYDAPSYAGPADPYKDQVGANGVLREIKECQDAAAAALAAGIPGTTPVRYSTHGSSLISPTPLQDISAKVCGKYKQLAEGNSSDGKLNRFLSALSGDKRTAFAKIPDVTLQGFKGPGGRNLIQPQDFAAAPRWYTYGHVADSYPERWYVEAWIFSGNKLVRRTSKEGWGRNPPTSAFP